MYCKYEAHLDYAYTQYTTVRLARRMDIHHETSDDKLHMHVRTLREFRDDLDLTGTAQRISSFTVMFLVFRKRNTIYDVVLSNYDFHVLPYLLWEPVINILLTSILLCNIL